MNPWSQMRYVKASPCMPWLSWAKVTAIAISTPQVVSTSSKCSARAARRAFRVREGECTTASCAGSWGEAHEVLGERTLPSSARFATPTKKRAPPVQGLAELVFCGDRRSGRQIPQLVAVLLSKLAQGPIPQLSDALAGDPHHLADFLERPRLAV